VSMIYSSIYLSTYVCIHLSMFERDEVAEVTYLFDESTNLVY